MNNLHIDKLLHYTKKVIKKLLKNNKLYSISYIIDLINQTLPRFIQCSVCTAYLRKDHPLSLQNPNIQPKGFSDPIYIQDKCALNKYHKNISTYRFKIKINISDQFEYIELITRIIICQDCSFDDYMSRLENTYLEIT